MHIWKQRTAKLRTEKIFVRHSEAKICLPKVTLLSKAFPLAASFMPPKGKIYRNWSFDFQNEIAGETKESSEWALITFCKPAVQTLQGSCRALLPFLQAAADELPFVLCSQRAAVLSALTAVQGKIRGDMQDVGIHIYTYRHQLSAPAPIWECWATHWRRTPATQNVYQRSSLHKHTSFLA